MGKDIVPKNARSPPGKFEKRKTFVLIAEKSSLEFMAGNFAQGNAQIQYTH